MNAYPKNILFLVPARLGDALMTTPAVQLIKQYCPESAISIITFSKLAASVFTHNPNVVKIYQAQDIVNPEKFTQDFDLCIITHINDELTRFAQKISIPIWRDEPADETQAQAAQSLKFIHACFKQTIAYKELAYQLFPDKKDFETIQKKLSGAPIPLFIGFHLGCHGINKQNFFRKIMGIHKKRHPKVWPLTHFIQLAKLLQKKFPQVTIVLTGGPNEKYLAEEFAQSVKNTLNLCGETSTLELTALMSQLKCFVSSDTGPMHIACAMQIPLIAIFGPTNSKRTGPYPTHANIHLLENPDMSKISAQKVANIIEPYLKPC